MYLSKLTLDQRNRMARRDLGDPYRMHQTLMAVAPDDTRLLWRAEPDAPGGPAVLVQTLAAPDWTRLPDGYARVDGPKSFKPTLREGDRLRFRLVANPTVKRKTGRSKRDGSPHATRVPLVHARAPEGSKASQGYLDWLDRKLNEAGAVVDVGNVADAPFEVRTRKGGHRITLFGVRFDGALTVRERDVLAEALRQGIGPAKGLGFGLLSLARA
ncbi:MAG: type I-E CRISPR-associated protein Cas6/Cse3/CasE [Bacteroidota bacterium]